jgi:hypothetical protein
VGRWKRGRARRRGEQGGEGEPEKASKAESELHGRGKGSVIKTSDECTELPPTTESESQRPMLNELNCGESLRS